MAEATRVLNTHLDHFCKEYINFLHRPWKIVCKKQGNHAVSGKDISRLFGSLADNISKEAKYAGIELSSVSLNNSEVDVFIFVSNSISNESTSLSYKSDSSENNPKCDDNKNIDLWFFGVRKTPYNSIQDHLSSCSPSNQTTIDLKHPLSSTDNSVAACLSTFVIAKYFSSISNILFLDPMCGTGTIPMVFQNICKNIGKHAYVVGAEIDYNSLKIAETKYRNELLQQKSFCDTSDIDTLTHFSTPNFILANTMMLPLRSNLFDVIIVDPPWGHRHGKHHVIMKNMFRWMMEWIRVLKDGGILGIVTIRTKQVLHEYNSHFNEGRGLELVERINFENSGMSQCCYFVFRKVNLRRTT
jgi:ubiquinone/menaquinone biosynthesis C-methylase UbiE